MSGSRRWARFLALAACVALGNAQAWQNGPAAYGIIGGTVFRDSGYSLPGATVVLTRKNDPKAKKLDEAVSDARGEFAFRVPPSQDVYVIKASLKGFQSSEKEASVSGGERIDVTLTLSETPKNQTEPRK